MDRLKNIKIKVGDALFCNNDGELSRIDRNKVIGIAIENSVYNKESGTWDVNICFDSSALSLKEESNG